ncbi:MAG TPA: LysE family transporter [Acidimicrobiia bacterium]|jgi:threonine/homoserine/homoserine lactone efflux protein
MEPLLTGVLAGYGIAIPVGAISILIVDVGLKHGFRPAFFAGAGAATADFLYAGLAVMGGAALAGAIGAVDDALRIISALVLVLIALIGLRRARNEAPTTAGPTYSTRNDLALTYARFLGLTIINPTTIVYFAAVIIGLGVADDMTLPQGITFVVGAFLASLSWQTLLATVGSSVGRRLTPAARTVATVLGNLVILGFAVLILLR